ncbi:MAG: hypothetical protein VX036_04865, partial [Pseudomonadota bacterium]|nr:hypothetical protein [Pseudomonadota bacterium]
LNIVTPTETRVTGNTHIMGNVGIGTTSPLSKLTVTSISEHNSIRLEKKSQGGDNSIEFKALYGNGTGNDSSDTWTSGIIRVTDERQHGQTNGGSWHSYMTFHTTKEASNSEKMRITKDGYVGIGIQSPQHKLDVSGTSRLNGNVDLNGIKVLDNGNTTYKRIEIKGGNSTGYIYGAYNNTGLGDGIHIGYNSYIEDGSSTWQIQADTVRTNRLSFSYNNMGFYQGEPGQPTTEPRLIINENGNVGIGTKTPQCKLHVKGASATLKLHTNAYTAEAAGSKIIFSNSEFSEAEIISRNHPQADQTYRGSLSFYTRRHTGSLALKRALYIEFPRTLGEGGDGNNGHSPAGRVGIGTGYPNYQLDV